MAKKCWIVWKDGRRRMFDIPSGTEIDDMPCSEVILQLFVKESLEHELGRHRREIDYVECDGMTEPVDKVTRDLAFCIDALIDRAAECLKEIEDKLGL